MSFSTWSRDFREHRRPRSRLMLLFAGVLLAPILWLASLQAGFDLTYPACWWGTRAILAAVVLAPLPAAALVAWKIARREPGSTTAPEEPWPLWLGSLGLLMCGYFALIALVMLAPVIGLDPCR